MSSIARTDTASGAGSSHADRKTQSKNRESTGVVDDATADALAHVVEAEILPRLRLLYQEPDATPTHQPTAEDADRLNALLLAPGAVDLSAEVTHLLDGDMLVDTLLDDLLIPAARHLGTLWDEDICDVLAVTEGLGRLQVLTRHLCAKLEARASPAGRSILLLPCPGETHSYALSIVASYFRKADWHATILDHAGADASDLLREGWFDAIGLSLACDVHRPVMEETVHTLRCASRNPSLAVIVGGPWFARHEVSAETVGADAYVADGQAAPRITEALLETRGVGRTTSHP